VITLISVLGVTLGITVLILVMSVMTGFERELQRKVIGFDAHLLVSNNGLLDGWKDLAGKASDVRGVEAAAPFVQGPVIVEFNHQRMAPKIRGIDPALEQKVSNLSRFIVAGKLDLDGDKTVMGSELARALGVSVGDTVTIYSAWQYRPSAGAARQNGGQIQVGRQRGYRVPASDGPADGAAGCRDFRERPLPV